MYYLQDSSLQYYALGITISGQPTLTTVSGPQTLISLIAEDANGIYWQFGATTSGQISATVVSSPPAFVIGLVDANGVGWNLGVTIYGQPNPVQAGFGGLDDGASLSFGLITQGYAITTVF